MTKLLERISDFLAEIGREDLCRETRDLQRKLAEDELQIVVVGEFKRGKSTLINALVGEPVLPMAVVPLTSVVTLVRCGKTRAAHVDFLDGRRENISFVRISEFVAEDRNPKNEKKVDRVIVELPVPFLREGTNLVDTPGVGSIYRHNTEVAERYFPKADAMILVLTVDPPISQSELEFLRSIRRWAKRLYVVLNKTDYLSAGDLQKSAEFVRNAIGQALGDSDISLFPISAKRGLEARKTDGSEAWRQSGMRSLEQSLERLLTDEKRKLLHQSVTGRAKHVLENLQLEIELEVKTLTGSARALEAQSASLKESLELAQRKQYEFSRLYKAELKDHLVTVGEGLYDYIRVRTKEVTGKLESLYRKIQNEPSSEVRVKLNKAFLEAAEESFLQYLEKEEPRWTRAFQKMTDRYLEGLTGLLNEALQQARSAAGIHHEPICPPELAISPPSIWFVLEEVTVWVKSFLPIPTLRMFKSVFLKAIKRRVAEAMDLNAGRLRYDYSRRLEKATGEVQNAVENFLKSSLAALDKTIGAIETRKTLTQVEFEQKLEIIHGRLRVIKELQSELDRATQ